jgi:hypothetical protein
VLFLPKVKLLLVDDWEGEHDKPLGGQGNSNGFPPVVDTPANNDQPSLADLGCQNQELQLAT